MKTIIQNANFSITVRRFDTGENITVDPNVPIEVDDETADYLINLKCIGNSGELETSEVEPIFCNITEV